MVHLQLLAQICSFSFCDPMDADEILKMEGYVSALDEEPDAEESPPSSDTLEMAPDGTVNPLGETEDAPLDLGEIAPLPETAPLQDTLLHLHNLDLGWMHAFRQGSVAEPDQDATYQNPFAEPEPNIEDEAQAHSTTKAKTKGEANTKGKPKTKGKAKKKAKAKPTSKAKTNGKPKTKGKAKKKAKPKPTSKAKTKGKPKTKGKAKTKAKEGEAQ